MRLRDQAWRFHTHGGCVRQFANSLLHGTCMPAHHVAFARPTAFHTSTASSMALTLALLELQRQGGEKEPCDISSRQRWKRQQRQRKQLQLAEALPPTSVWSWRMQQAKDRALAAALQYAAETSRRATANAKCQRTKSQHANGACRCADEMCWRAHATARHAGGMCRRDVLACRRRATRRHAVRASKLLRAGSKSCSHSHFRRFMSQQLRGVGPPQERMHRAAATWRQHRPAQDTAQTALPPAKRQRHRSRKEETPTPLTPEEAKAQREALLERMKKARDAKAEKKAKLKAGVAGCMPSGGVPAAGVLVCDTPAPGRCRPEPCG